MCDGGQTSLERLKVVFGGDSDVLRAGEANATILEPLVGPHSVLVLDGPEHVRQRKLILPALHGDRMRAWEAAIRDITRAEIARWPVGKPFALRPSMQSITLDVIVRSSSVFSAGAGSVFPISVEAGQPGDFHQLVEFEDRVAVGLGDEILHRGVLGRQEIPSGGCGDADVSLEDGGGLVREQPPGWRI